MIVDWEGWKVQVVTQPVPFPDLPVRRVSVNSFGYGGTNAHMIIEGADSFLPFPSTYSDSQKKRKIPRGTFHLKRPFLLPFSAHDKPTLKRNIAAYGQVAAKYNLLDLSYTLANRRSRLPSKGFVVASHASLDGAFQPNMEAFSFAEKKRPGAVGFAFTGQGAQWVRMGSELMAYYPSFLRTIRQLDLALEDLPDGPDWTLEDVLLEDVKTSRVNEAEFSQPLCTAIQIAIVRLLDAWGIKPVVTVGHSSGEIAAAFAAGLISATEAIVAAYYRGQVVSKVTANGAMMAVGLGAEAAAPFLERLDGKVVIACHNSPSSVTLSGDVDALETVKSKLDAENIFARMVKTGGKAYHSHHMQPVAAAYESLMRNAKAYSNFDLPQPSNAIMVSSVTTAPITGDNVIDSSYWSANLRSPVLFNQAVQRIATDSQFSNVDLLVEIGPHSALSGPIRQICVAHGFNKLGYVPTLLRGEDSASQLLKLAGELFLRDYPLQMERITLIEEPLPSGKIHLVKGSLLVDLPTYQWNYAKDFWAEVRHSREHRAPSHARHDILGGFLPGGSLAEPSWRNKLRIRDIPWLKDHSLGGEAVFPAAAYFSMAMEAITQIHELGPNKTIIEGYVLRDISIKAALVTPDDDDGIEVIYNMRPSVHSEADAQNEWWDFSVSSISDDGYRNDHIAGSISINTRARGQTPKEVPNMLHRATGKSWNQQLREVGFDYGPTFQDMTDIRSDGKTYAAACTTVIKSESGVMEGESRYVLHPGAVDSCLQLLIVAIYAGRLNDMICGAVPIQVDEVAIWTPTADQLKVGSAQAYSWVDQRGIRSFVGGSQLVSSDGELLMEISDMRCTAYEAAVPLKSEEPMKPQPYGEMVWKHDIDSLNSAPIPVNMDITNLIDLAIHKNPALKVIEIDSSYAAAIIPKLGLLDYTVTAKTDEAVEQLNVLTQSYKKVEVLKLDISLEAPGQDKLQSCFDLVVASVGWLGPTTSKNLRDLLVPGGRAILELDAQQSLAPLHEADFSGTHLVLQSQGKSIVVLTAAMDSSLEGNTNGVNNEVVLVYRKSPAAILTPLHKAFEDAGWNATTTSLDACQCKAGGHVIMLADFEGPLLASLEEKELVAIQDLTRTVSSILWVTPGGLLSGKKPEYAMAAGLARSITSEQVALDITTLDFDLDTILEPDVVEIIVKTVERKSRKSGIRESEYYVSEGQIYISRLLPNNQINDAYAYDKEETEAGFLKPDMCLVGRAESGKVVFEADNRVEEPLEADDVEVTVSVCGMNREDILVISGSDYPTTFSHEVGGIVKRVGSHVTGLAVGDEVVGFSFDKFATHQRVHATFLQKLEKGEVLNELVSLPMAYGAALHGLKNLANVQAKETVLILGGTGSPGIAAIAVAKLMNAVPYIAVSNEAEGTRLKSRFGLTESQILLSSEQSIGSQLKAATGRSGADVVFSSGSVQAFIARECWRDIAPFGRFVATGRKNVLKRAVVDTVPLHRGASYLSFDMLDLHAWKPHVLKELLALAISLYRRQAIPALEPISIKNIAEIDDAVASFSDNFHSGKTVLSYEPSETALRILRSRPSFKFRADATYLLVGCLGGLGRSLTSWMMKKGARRFAFLSRSGTDSKQAAILVDDLQAAGVVVDVIRGDVSVEADVKRAVSLIPADHPVRGVVQAAMVLKVRWVISVQR
jgi:acyl transferase domain-containing protein/NADPH:quinone reductase-like Zn-dependent oxidoreductase